MNSLEQCNCSICTKKGALLYRVTPENLRITQDEEALALYQFNKKITGHYFCRHCGIYPFHWPRAAPDLYTINVCCLGDFDLDKANYTLHKFDGQHWEQSVAA